MTSESLILVLIATALGATGGIAFMYAHARSKATDLRGEAIKAATLAVNAIAKMTNEDDLIAAAIARKAANTALTETLKSKIALL